MSERAAGDLPSLGSLGRPARRAVVVSQESLVNSSSLLPGSSLPLLIEPALEDVDLVGWAKNHLDQIEAYLDERGGILFRGFNLGGIDRFQELNQATSRTGLLEYSYRSTPRTQVQGKIYTSTEYPAQQHIPLHNEMAYSRSWPLRITFFCVKNAERGGETPIADSRRVHERIPREIREEFAARQVLYVRNYGQGLDLPWQTVFQTESREDVERFCREHGIELEWKDDGGLRTKQLCQAVAVHPRTGAPVWFNQAHLFHFSSLEPALRESLLRSFGEENLPRNACFGDGSPIDPAALAEIRRAYQEETVAFPWQEGDVLLLDNMLTAHGRAPFEGERKILVGMSDESSAA
ncbi:MAG TPA: taurine catabolism dioxygenase TauD [Acidobacteria bacterium]|nr:taurine catabolism dioxygenase TauD [Acidobacteriota bacterium]